MERRSSSWSTRLDCDHDNFRAALAWALSAGEADSALRLVGALEPYWETRGHIVEGRRWLTAALAAESSSAPVARAKALFGASRLVSIEGDYLQERRLLEEAVKLFRQGSERRGLIFALAHLGIGLARLGELAASASTSRRAVALARALHDRWLLAMTLNCQATALLDEDRFTAARPAIEESLELRRALGEKRGIAVTVATLGELWLAQGKGAEAIEPFEEALSLSRQLGNVALEAQFLTSLGLAAVQAGQADRARVLLAQGLVACWEIADKETMSEALVGLAAIHLDANAAYARELWDGANALRARLRTRPRAHLRPTYESVLKRLPSMESATNAGPLDTRTLDEALTELIVRSAAEAGIPHEVLRA